MKILTIILTLFLFSRLALAQSTDSAVHRIRATYHTIRTHLVAYDTTMTTIWDESTEGTQAIAYYDPNDKLKLMEVTSLGETNKRVTAYYFDNEKLIFAFDQHFDYNRPIYWNDKTAKEMGDNEVFDPQKTSIKEDRYYFKNEKLFLWIDNEGKKADLTLGTNITAGQGLIALAYKIREEVKR